MELLKKNIMQFTASRRVFLAGAAALAASIALLKKTLHKDAQSATARFLTRDGKLVDVPVEKVPLKKIAITKGRLVSWIWKHQKL